MRCGRGWKCRFRECVRTLLIAPHVTSKPIMGITTCSAPQSLHGTLPKEAVKAIRDIRCYINDQAEHDWLVTVMDTYT